MRKYLSVIITAVLLSAVMAATAADHTQRIYAFGFAASFADSTVYITDLQPVDSVYIEKRTGFLENRDQYSTQLRDYLAGQDKPHRTCAFFFAVKQKDAEKTLMKMKKRYGRNGQYEVKYIPSSDFTFRTVTHYEEATEQPAVPGKKEKKRKKNKGKSEE